MKDVLGYNCPQLFGVIMRNLSSASVENFKSLRIIFHLRLSLKITANNVRATSGKAKFMANKVAIIRCYPSILPSTNCLK
jgi:hypothetical protein